VSGELGAVGTLSFFPTKNLGAWGDAGMVVSNDPEFISRVRQIANHGGGANKYDNVVLGTNSRLDTLQAAVLRVKLRHIDAWNRERAEAARRYTEALGDVPDLVLPREHPGARSAWHLFTTRTPDREGLRAHLASKGIATAVHYPRPIHLQPAMAAAGGEPGDLPVSERLSEQVLSLPLYPEIRPEQIARVSAEVHAWSEARAGVAAT
jgi:dTDP-4-amino-4,6-dideoxygalactose transaminase